MTVIDDILEQFEADKRRAGIHGSWAVSIANASAELSQLRFDLASVCAERDALKAERDDARMMLRLQLRATSATHTDFIESGDRNEDSMPTSWKFKLRHGDLVIEVPDDGTGLPLLNAAARDALKGTT